MVDSHIPDSNPAQKSVTQPPVQPSTTPCWSPPNKLGPQNPGMPELKVLRTPDCAGGRRRPGGRVGWGWSEPCSPSEGPSSWPGALPRASSTRLSHFCFWAESPPHTLPVDPLQSRRASEMAPPPSDFPRGGPFCLGLRQGSGAGAANPETAGRCSRRQRSSQVCTGGSPAWGTRRMGPEVCP